MKKYSRYGRGKQKENKVEECESNFSTMDQPLVRGFDFDRRWVWSLRGRGRGGNFEGICFKCLAQGHGEFECIEIMKNE